MILLDENIGLAKVSKDDQAVVNQTYASAIRDIEKAEKKKAEFTKRQAEPKHDEKPKNPKMVKGAKKMHLDESLFEEEDCLEEKTQKSEKEKMLDDLYSDLRREGYLVTADMSPKVLYRISKKLNKDRTQVSRRDKDYIFISDEAELSDAKKIVRDSGLDYYVKSTLGTPSLYIVDKKEVVKEDMLSSNNVDGAEMSFDVQDDGTIIIYDGEKEIKKSKTNPEYAKQVLKDLGFKKKETIKEDLSQEDKEKLKSLPVIDAYRIFDNTGADDFIELLSKKDTVEDLHKDFNDRLSLIKAWNTDYITYSNAIKWEKQNGDEKILKLLAYVYDESFDDLKYKLVNKQNIQKARLKEIEEAEKKEKEYIKNNFEEFLSKIAVDTNGIISYENNEFDDSSIYNLVEVILENGLDDVFSYADTKSALKYNVKRAIINNITDLHNELKKEVKLSKDIVKDINDCVSDWYDENTIEESFKDEQKAAEERAGKETIKKMVKEREQGSLGDRIEAAELEQELKEDYYDKFNITPDRKIKEVYTEVDPGEYQLDWIHPEKTIADIWSGMQAGEDLYRIASVDGRGFDSAVREGIFEIISKAFKIPYDTVYSTWRKESFGDDDDEIEDTSDEADEQEWIANFTKFIAKKVEDKVIPPERSVVKTPGDIMDGAYYWQGVSDYDEAIRDCALCRDDYETLEDCFREYFLEIVYVDELPDEPFEGQTLGSIIDEWELSSLEEAEADNYGHLDEALDLQRLNPQQLSDNGLAAKVIEDGGELIPNSVEPGPDAGLATELNKLIRDEWEAIQGYNDAIVMAELEGFHDVAKVFKDIVNEENVHVGQLEECMKLVSPNTDSINHGEVEATGQLTESKSLNESTWNLTIKNMPKAASEKLSFINDYDREHDTDYFEELREEIYEETDGIIDNVHVDMYGLTKNTFRGTEDKPYYTEEDYKNAVKIMFKKINDCYKKLTSESEDPEEGMHY